MSDQNVVELERRLQDLMYEVNRLRGDVTRLGQQLPKAWMSGQPPGGGAGVNIYLARSDGAAQGTGTFPSLTKDTFTSDVVDTATGDVVATGASVEWWATDALTTAGALVWCIRRADGTYVGLFEQCSAVDEDPE